MTVQKAMRVRSELKKRASALLALIDSVEYSLSFEGNQHPTDEEISAKRNEKLFSLDGMTYAEAVKKYFDITEACETLNLKIEAVNQAGHNLLFKEATLKSKLAFVEMTLEKERQIVPESKTFITDYENTDAKGNYRKVEKSVYSYPILDNSCFGLSLSELEKKLTKEIEAVRDQLQDFNASATIDFQLPDGLI